MGLKKHHNLLAVIVFASLWLLWVIGLLTGLWGYPATDISYTIAVLALAVVMGCYGWFLRDEPNIRIFACLAACVLFINLLERQPQNYTYDFFAHQINIAYYAQHFWYPPLDSPEANQPPLYYLLAGIIYKFSTAFGLTESQWLGVASLDYFFYALFLLYGIRLILYSVPTRFLAWLGIAVLLAWPHNLLSFRISNDMLVYLSMAGCMYHFTRWYKESRLSQLKIAIFWLAIGAATKNSIVILLPPMALLLGVKCGLRWNPGTWIRGLGQLSWQRHVRPLRWALLLLAIGLASGVGRNLYSVMTLGNTSIIEGRYGGPSHFKFEPAFLEFAPVAFLAHPYYIDFNYDKEISGRDDLYWNFFLRTLSFGEYIWNGTIQANIINALMLMLWAYMILTMGAHFFIFRQAPGWAGYYGVFILCMMMAHAINKMSYDGWHILSDARHILPVFDLFLIACLDMTDRYRRLWSPAYMLGVFLLVSYLSVSIVHDLLQIATMDYARFPAFILH